MSSNKKNEILIHTITWINLKHMLSKTSQTQKGDSIYKKFKNRQKIIYSYRNQYLGNGWRMTGKKHEKTFWDDGNVLYHDLDDVCMCICICQNLSVCMINICAFDYT